MGGIFCEANFPSDSVSIFAVLCPFGNVKAFWANLAVGKLGQNFRLFFGQSQLFSLELGFAEEEVIYEDDPTEKQKLPEFGANAGSGAILHFVGFERHHDVFAVGAIEP
jgi:hypothetical protein